MASADLAATQRWMLAAIAGDGAAPEPVVVEGQDRLDIYRRGYRSRLVGCLRETYPGLRHALGDEVFEAFALDYLEAHPPCGYTLNALGAGWPEHLEATRPHGEDWPEFVVDLARLERMFCEVYDAEGVDGTPADAHARLLHARYPVARYLAAVRRGDDPPLPAAKATTVAISRRNWVVLLEELEANEVAR